MKNQKTILGFTLLEILIAIMVISVIVGISLPSFLIVLEKFNLEEGKQALYALYTAEKHYHLENNTFTNDIAKLDVELRLKNFELFDALHVQGNVTYIGKLTRKRNGTIIYHLGIIGQDTDTPTNNGQFRCWPSAEEANICQKIGIQLAGS